MKKDTHETRGRPRKSKYTATCLKIRQAVESEEFHKTNKGHVITVEDGPVDGQIHCSYSYKELREELAGKGLSITAYNKKGMLLFRIRKVR